MPENSICHEIDTGKHYYLANGEWHQLPARGGGEGGGTVEPFFVTATVDGETVTFDKTFAQTQAAIEAGRDVYLTRYGVSYPLNRFSSDHDLFAAWIVGDVDEQQEIGIAEENGETVGWISDIQSGGGDGAEKFVVELEEDKGEWNSKTSIADILAAAAANQVVVCKLGFEEIPVVIEIPMNGESGGAVIFGGASKDLTDPYANSVYTAVGVEEGGGVDWSVVITPIPTSSNAPLKVTLTESEGAITGDKTYQEVMEARLAGRPVDIVMAGYFCSSVLDVSVGEVDGESEISVTLIFNGQVSGISGAPSDYIGITLD